MTLHEAIIVVVVDHVVVLALFVVVDHIISFCVR